MTRVDLDWYLISRRSAVAIIVIVLLLVGGGTTAYLYLTSENPVDIAGDKQIARFLSLEGNVKVKRANASYFIAVNRGTPLETGDTVQTDIDGHAQIKFVDGSTYALGPDSTMVIRLHVLNPRDQTSTVDVGVASGLVKVTTSGSNDAINKVETLSTSSSFDASTKATVAAMRSGETNIDVLQGGAKVTTQDGRQTRVSANERLQVASSGSIISHEKLLPSPRLVEPADSATINGPEDKVNLVLNWNPVSEALRYHVVVSTSRYFTQTVAEGTDVRAPGFALEDLPPGRYFWQVKAFDGAGRSSPFSDPYQFTIAGRAGGRTLEIVIDEINPLSPTLFEIRGHTVAGAQVSINGKPAKVDGDGRFKALVTLAETRSLTIEAEDQSGNRGRIVRRI